MFPSIQAISAFVKTVSLGSFAAAANELNQTPAAISKQVKSLEKQLNTRLLNRTTRQLSLTEEGDYLYQRYCRALAQLDESNNWLESRREQIAGKLRVNVPLNIGRHRVLPLMPKFKAAYPHIALELFFDDQTRDPIAYGFDVGIRGGALPDSGLVARKLMPMQFMLCGSPEYVASHPPIKQPKDLIAHQQIRFRITGKGDVQPWVLTNGEESVIIEQNNPLIVNNQDASLDAMLMNMGIGYLETYYCKPLIESGKLVQVLADYRYEMADRAYYLYYPHRENLAPKVRAFVDFLLQQIK